MPPHGLRGRWPPPPPEMVANEQATEVPKVSCSMLGSKLKGLVWFAALRFLHAFSHLHMKDQMKSIYKIFSGMSVIFRDESNDGN